MRALVLVMVMCSVAAAESREPRAIVLVVDRALSAEKLAMVRQAVADVAFDKADRIGIVAYGPKAKVVAPLGPKQTFALVHAKEHTRIVTGLEAAQAMLQKSTALKRVIVITDGDAQLGVATVGTKLRGDGITISAIGIESMNKHTLDAIARAGKGWTYRVEDTAALAAALQAEADRARPVERSFAYVFLIERSMLMEGVSLEAAKEVARVGIEVVGPHDVVSVVAFDDAAQTLASPQPAAKNRMRISADIARVKAGGYVNLVPALKLAADHLAPIKATTKQVFVIGSGRGPLDGVVDVLKAMQAANITVSTVAVPDSERLVLEKIAFAGNGKFVVWNEPGLPRLFLTDRESD